MPDNGTSQRWTRKRLRLGAAAYAQPGAICSVTIAVQDRRPIFGDPVVASAAVDVLRSHVAKTGVPVYAYCIMPEHVHVLVGPSATCDVTTFVGQFKNLAQRAAWQHGVDGSFWQRSYWDHFLRAEEQVEQAVEYVRNNPVRRGLVDEAGDYPFSGSLVFGT